MDVAAKPALQARGVGGLQEGLGAMTLQTQSLQGLPLAVEGLVDGHDVVRLGRGGVDGRCSSSSRSPRSRREAKTSLAARGAGPANRSPAWPSTSRAPPRPRWLRYRHSTKPRMATWGWCPCPSSSARATCRSWHQKCPGSISPRHSFQSRKEGHAGLAALPPVAGLVPRFRITEGHVVGPKKTFISGAVEKRAA